MANSERSGGPPYFDGNNYSRWAVRMLASLAGKGSLLREVTEDEGYQLPVIQVTQLDRDKVEANNKAVDLLYHSLGPNEFDRVMGEKMANMIWAKLRRSQRSGPWMLVPDLSERVREFHSPPRRVDR